MFLLDTNVVSELRKVRSGRADAGVAAWSRKVRTVDLFISAITVHELEIGCLLAERRDSVQGVALRNWLDAHVLRAFENRIIPVDLAVARQSASFHVPDPCSLEDGLIAATAGRIWVESKVDFSEPKNLLTVATALILGAGDLKLPIFGFELGGIGTATFGAIALYHLLDRKPA